MTIVDMCLATMVQPVIMVFTLSIVIVSLVGVASYVILMVSSIMHRAVHSSFKVDRNIFTLNLVKHLLEVRSNLSFSFSL